uniref:MORN repeat-containing protein n=1 Tax=Flavobacterium sp. TaxID=239 RepID=UPI00404B3739
MSGNCKNRYGTFIDSIGNKYSGDWKDKKKNGIGTYTFLNGVYVGEWKDDKQNGQGKIILSDGTEYVGEWKDGLKNGRGTYTWSRGEKYVGEWKDDKQNGQGIKIWPDGTVYEGKWEDGKPIGKCTITWPSGQKYVGERKDGLKNGQGTFTWPSGQKYVGEWKDDKQNGQGKIILSDGTEYVGEWKDGIKNGQGTYTWSRGEKYVGEWKDDKQNGQGTKIWPDGTVYEGKWEDGKLNGQGTKTYPDGTVQEVLWQDGIIKPPLSFIKENVYNINFLTNPNSPDGKSNLKVFRNIISTNNSIFSLVYCPPTNNIFNLQHFRIGHFFIETSASSNLTTYAEFKNNGSDSKINYKSYNLNNNITDLNKIFKISRERNSLTFNEITLDIINNKIYSDEKFSLANQFELNSNGGIETYNIISSAIGNGIGAFDAYSTYHSKTTYLFLYKYKSKSKFTKIDLCQISNNFKSYNEGRELRYEGIINDKKVNSHLFIEQVIQNDKYSYVFLNASEGNVVLPIKVDKNNTAKLVYESIFIKGNCYNQEFSDAYVCEDGYFYLPVSQGFINYNKIDNNQINLRCFDSELQKLWEKSVFDLKINHVYESGDFIILGGYTKLKGYLGYPNPKIVVINKKTRAITFEKVLAKKNGEIDCISQNNSGSIIIGIGSFCCHAYDTDSDFKPQIIIDKLDATGKFINDLFKKNEL